MPFRYTLATVPLNVLFNQLGFGYVCHRCWLAQVDGCYVVRPPYNQIGAYRNRVDVSIFVVSTFERRRWFVAVVMVREFCRCFGKCEVYLQRHSNHYYIKPYVVGVFGIAQPKIALIEWQKKTFDENIMCQTHLMQKRHLKNDIEFGNEPEDKRGHSSSSSSSNSRTRKTQNEMKKFTWWWWMRWTALHRPIGVSHMLPICIK